MNQLTVLNNNGQLLVESREVAEMTGVRHADLMRTITGYLQILENAKLRSQDFFIPSSYKVDGNNKRYDCFLLTRKGCDMVANKMTGEKGVLFTAAYVSQFEEMEKKLADPYANLSPEVRAIFAVDSKVQKLENRIEELDNKVETQITITQGEQRGIQKAVSRKVHEFAVDDDHRRLLFPELYREIKDRWGVPSYRDILRKDLQAVINYINAWQPKRVSA